MASLLLRHVRNVGLSPYKCQSLSIVRSCFPVKQQLKDVKKNLIKLSEESPLKINVNALINIGKLRGGMFMPTHSR